MSAEKTRDRILEAVRHMRNNTVAKGCTPAEAARFAAKAAEWIEKYHIDEAELRAKEGGGYQPDIEMCQNILRTGKKVFNPGMTQVVNALATGMCCKVIMLPAGYDGYPDCAYGIVGDTLDADYVCQVSLTVVPALQIMATWEGREHGHEKAGLVRWTNQYLTGAALEIQGRLERDRKDRSEMKELEHHLANPGAACTAISCITGEQIAVTKRHMAKEAFDDLYPQVRKSHIGSRTQYDPEAVARGREAGKTVGLRIELE